jgi:7-carboxy-7-deazaguanine synthase
MSTSIRISEVFASIQGEGPSAGTPSVFVRLQGCAVGCVWCDTKYTWDPTRGEETSLRAVLTAVTSHGIRNVVVTGGEPLENPAFVSLVSGLKRRGKRVEVETAGTEIPPQAPVDQWNVSLKLAHSGVPARRRLRRAAITAFRDRGAWFKFVVAEERDVNEVLDIQKRYALRADRIVLMPLGIRHAEQHARMRLVADLCLRHGFRLSPRLQILIWGPKRGT